jgi:peptidoglycan hydrolase-like protein with peptidoglycan-binding domain
MKTLTLTTPLTHGPAVDRAQRILTNRGYFVGTIDGVFGEITGRACVDAKYALGYAAKNVKPSYGTDLEAFLCGKKPTPAMRIRANQRKKKITLGCCVEGCARVRWRERESARFKQSLVL